MAKSRIRYTQVLLWHPEGSNISHMTDLALRRLTNMERFGWVTATWGISEDPRVSPKIHTK